jgi:hypothetical protein
MVLGLVVITAALVGVLAQTPKKVIASNYVKVAEELGLFPKNTTVCQAGERIPASTVALRISIVAHVGPAVAVTVSHAGHIVAKGQLDAGWESASPTLPIHPPVAEPLQATICLTRAAVALPVELAGSEAPKALLATSNGQALEGRMRVEYLGTGNRSWLSLAKQVARRLGLGHATSGAWIALPLIALMTMMVALAAWLLMREARHE